MELAEVLMEVLTKIKVWVETQQPKELKVFNSLKLSIVVAVATIVTALLTIAIGYN